MSDGRKRAPRGAQQTEIARLTQALQRIQDIIRETGLRPSADAWEVLGSIAFIVNRALAVQS